MKVRVEIKGHQLSEASSAMHEEVKAVEIILYQGIAISVNGSEGGKKYISLNIPNNLATKKNLCILCNLCMNLQVKDFHYDFIIERFYFTNVGIFPCGSLMNMSKRAYCK